MSRRGLALSAALVLAASRARANEPLPFSMLATPDDAGPAPGGSGQAPARIQQPEPASATDPGFFNGLGTQDRGWELQSDATFSTSRVFTQRFEIGHAFSFNRLFAIVARVDFGADTDTNSGFYAIHGPLLSLGVRDRSPDANEWIEVGVRVIPNWSGPGDTNPAALNLSLNASLSSGGADDARWLAFSRFGWQLYGAIQSRTQPLQVGSCNTFALGTVYGGEVSLPPLQVQSWLGPQTGFIGNAFAEVFLDAPRLGGSPVRLQVGVHGEVSLSSIWPGSDIFPIEGNAFLGWSPTPWLSARIFTGIARAVVGPVPVSNPYGLRVIGYVP